jgi:hypothetical protein
MTINIPSPANWKTTVSGILAAVGSYLAMFPNTLNGHPTLENIAKFIAIGGLASLGFSAKDLNVTGGNTANSANDPAVVQSTTVPKP